MIRHTFQHISGIGEKTETALWKADIHSWQDVENGAKTGVSDRQRALILGALPDSEAAFAKGDPAFFLDRLPARLHWRMFRALRDRAVYLDIETTGGRMETDEITTIATWDGRKIRTYVRGENLGSFLQDLPPAPFFVTYSGKSFDIPVMERSFGVRLSHHPHLDLRHVLGSIGLKGGLKGVERKLGIARLESQGLDGLSAVRLWNRYCQGAEQEVLDTLLAYNIEDSVVLERLAVFAWNQLIGTTPFAETLRLPDPPVPASPFHADPAVTAWLRASGGDV